MTLIKKNTFLPTFPLFFDDFFSRDLLDWQTHNRSITHTTIPSVNILEGNEGFTVEMAAPGMGKKDFKIDLDNETLTITSQKELNQDFKKDQKFIRREFSYQSFQRSFHLPKSVVDDSKIRARYENGILRILIPKREEAKALPPRQIAIS